MRTLALTMIVLMVAGTAVAGELTLPAAIEAALAGHPELLAARADVEAARADARQAGAWSNPAAFLRLEAAPYDGDFWNDAGRIVGLSQEIPLSGRRGAARGVGEAAAQVAGLDLEGRTHVLEARVRRAYARAWHAQQAVVMRGEAGATADELLALVRRRADAGDAAEMTVLRARMAASSVQADLLAEQSRRTGALAELSALLDRPLTSDVTLAAMEFGDELLPDGEATGVRAALARVEAEAATVSLAGRQRWPDLELEAGLRTAPDGDAFDAGLRVVLPLWDRGSARMQAARARRSASEHLADATRRAVSTARQTAVARRAAARSALKMHQESVVPDAEAALAAVRAAFDAGDVTLSEVLQVSREWIDARLAQLDWAREVALAEADLVEVR